MVAEVEGLKEVEGEMDTFVSLANYWPMMLAVSAVSVVFSFWQGFDRQKYWLIGGAGLLSLVLGALTFKMGLVDGNTAALIYGIAVTCLPVLLVPLDYGANLLDKPQSRL